MTKHPTNVDYALQEYTCMDSSNINNINNCKKFVREKIGGAWTDWKNILGKTELYSSNINVGQTVTLKDDISKYRFLQLDWYGAFSILVPIPPSEQGLIRTTSAYYIADNAITIVAFDIVAKSNTLKLNKITAVTLAVNSATTKADVPQYLSKIYRNSLGGDEMTETIIVSVISLIGTLGGSLGGILVANKLTNYRVEQLEKKVEKHNSVVERTYKLEGRMTEAEHDIRDLKERK